MLLLLEPWVYARPGPAIALRGSVLRRVPWKCWNLVTSFVMEQFRWNRSQMLSVRYITKYITLSETNYPALEFYFAFFLKGPQLMR